MPVPRVHGSRETFAMEMCRWPRMAGERFFNPSRQMVPRLRSQPKTKPARNAGDRAGTWRQVLIDRVRKWTYPPHLGLQTWAPLESGSFQSEKRVAKEGNLVPEVLQPATSNS